MQSESDRIAQALHCLKPIADSDEHIAHDYGDLIVAISVATLILRGEIIRDPQGRNYPAPKAN